MLTQTVAPRTMQNQLLDSAKDLAQRAGFDGAAPWNGPEAAEQSGASQGLMYERPRQPQLCVSQSEVSSSEIQQRSAPLERQDSAHYETQPAAWPERRDSAQELQVLSSFCNRVDP